MTPRQRRAGERFGFGREPARAADVQRIGVVLVEVGAQRVTSDTRETVARATFGVVRSDGKFTESMAVEQLRRVARSPPRRQPR